MLVTCPQCQFTRELPEDKIPARAQVATCPKCKHKFRFRELPPEEAGQEAAAPESPAPEAVPAPPPTAGQAEPEGDIWDRLGAAAPGERPAQTGAPEGDPFAADPVQPQAEVPFERLDQFGFFQGLAQTIRRALFDPRLFFEAMPLRGLGRPLAFAVLLGEFQIIFQILWSASGLLGDSSETGQFGLGLALAAAVILGPLFLSVFLFLETVIFHFCLVLFRAGSKGFEGTFRVLAYSNAPLVLSCIPLAGPILGYFWSLALAVIGARRLHRASLGTALGAFVLFVLIVFSIVGFMYYVAATVPTAAGVK
jgi:hypothetical protein